jgi:hypothetical protein
MDLPCNGGSQLGEPRLTREILPPSVLARIIDPDRPAIQEEALLQKGRSDIETNAEGRSRFKAKDPNIRSSVIDVDGLEVPAQIAMGEIGKDMRSFILLASKQKDITELRLGEPIDDATKESLVASSI